MKISYKEFDLQKVVLLRLRKVFFIVFVKKQKTILIKNTSL